MSEKQKKEQQEQHRLTQQEEAEKKKQDEDRKEAEENTNEAQKQEAEVTEEQDLEKKEVATDEHNDGYSLEGQAEQVIVYSEADKPQVFNLKGGLTLYLHPGEKSLPLNVDQLSDEVGIALNRGDVSIKKHK